jgi:hypothetical protein
VVNMIELPLTLATAGVVGLGGLALLMGAALSSVAELLALFRERNDWAGGELAWQDRCDARSRRSEGAEVRGSSDRP